MGHSGIAAWGPAVIPQPTGEEFDRFRELIARHAGIHLTESKRALLHSRLAPRLQQLGVQSYGEYFARVTQDAAELESMTDRITTNETRFFRERDHFDYLVEHLVPAWERAAAAGERPREVHVWSAGCSTGEEPYSVAMALRDRLSDAWTIEILATDLSTRALAVAREATWPIERAREIPPQLTKRFMLQSTGSRSGKLRAGSELRRLVRVEPLNLNAPPYAVRNAGFDVILCRNVLIYFDPEQRLRVLEQLAGHLARGGCLLVGHAETALSVAALRCVLPTVYSKRDGASGDR
jgi:chemotaxis protein methyltransferase CheR